MNSNITQTLKDAKVETVHVGQFDYAGAFRERRLRLDQFAAWAAAPRFPNVLPYWDAGEVLFGDGPYLSEEVEVDGDSLRKYGFEENAAAVIADYIGASGDLMPRRILKAQVDRAAKMGFKVESAFEFETIVLTETPESMRASNFKEPAQFVPENKCWSGQTAAEQSEFVTGLERAILDMDIALFAVAGELGPGCFEITLGKTPGIRSADDAAFCRLATRAYARRCGMMASFMPLLGAGYSGIGGHINLSLVDAGTGQNLFRDPSGATNALAKNFIAGMSEIVPHAFAMCASTVNAYRRFAPGSWAPKSLNWAEWTFTTAVRSSPGDNDSARLEFRVPGADCNPHLTLALMLGAGLDGIERELEAVPPAETGGPDDIAEGVIPFPRDLLDAAERLKNSVDARRIFGDTFVDHFAKACTVESKSLAREVSNAERRRYLEG